MHDAPFQLKDVLVFLVAAGVIAPALHRARISPVLTFLMLGVIIGPFGLGGFSEAHPWVGWVTISDAEGAAFFAELGVVLLLFVVGLEISVRHLLSIRRLVFGFGGAQVLVSAAVIGGVLTAFGVAPFVSLVLGLGFALSSTAIVLQLLSDRGQLGSRVGQGAFAALLLQDLAVVPILLMVSFAGEAGEGPVWRAVGAALLTAGLVLAAILILGRLFAGRLLRFAAGARAPELLTAAVLLLIVVTTAATSASGLSLALGAFLAGLLLAETEFRHDVDVTLGPFKGLFLAFFFLTVGMGIDVPAALAQPLAVLAGLAGLIAVKAVIAASLARLFGLAWPAAIEVGLLLGGAGEFAFVILAAGQGVGLFQPGLAPFMTLLAGASMALTPLLAALGRWIGVRLERRMASPVEAPTDLSGHVIVVGYGRVGALLVDMLAQEAVATQALDLDPTLVSRARDRGAAVSFGDARKTEILSKLGAARALALAVTTDDPDAAEAIVAAAKRAWPNLTIYARARDGAHAARLLAVGASRVTPEALEASLDLSEAVLRAVGLSEEAARSRIDARRSADMNALRAG